MRIREYTSEIWVQRPIDEVFAFFSDAANLNALTPPSLKFQIVTSTPIDMRVGALIDYRLRIHGVPIRWRTRITVWKPPHQFVDEQLRGPYRLWEHHHQFESKDGGTIVCDRVRYAIPFDFIAYPLMVRRDMERIFGYRQHRLTELFGLNR